ncbi:hypothetical protein EC988_005523 [Linderina pennispora]|nr:hypothetical protein EC988_005523 [Linderina pennispora]
MAFAAGAAVTLPTIGALGTLAYQARNMQGDNKPGDGQQRRPSFLQAENTRSLILEDDPSEFSSFSSNPSIMDQRMMTRRESMPEAVKFDQVKPDMSLLEEPHLQTWRTRYMWGRRYGMNFAHNDR